MTQKIQHRLGNYQIMGLLSYGSTSHVFKINELEQINTEKLPQQNQSQFELITIDMTYYRNQSNEKNVSKDFPKKDLILKLYNLERMLNKNNEFLDEVKYDILVEIIFLTYLQHPGIVQAKQMLLQYENLPSKDGNKSQKKLIKAGIVMQICQKGCFNSLCNYINRTKVLKQNKPKIMKFYLSQVANTLMYLNKQCKILHRDLKAQNIMVNKELDIKVIDYGISKININYLEKIFNHPQKQTIFNLFGFDSSINVRDLYNKIKHHETHRKNLIGSKHYISPELVQKYRSDMEMIDQAYEKTDIWSFGVLMYKIFHDKYPFDGKNLRQTLDHIVNQQSQPEINPDLPQQVKQVIKKCLMKDYQQRPGWDEIINCQFFKQTPQQQIFLFQSPIASLLEEHKRQKSHLLENIQKTIFDEKLVLKYQDQTSKKRRVLIMKQKQKESFKLLILKQKQSISFQILLTDRQCLKIKKNQNFLEISFLNNHQINSIKIFYDNSKETVQKLVDSLNQVFQWMKKEDEKQNMINLEQSVNPQQKDE